MSFDKKGGNKISVLSVIAVLAISISLVVGAVSINNSLNQTNNTPINEIPLLNESLNLAINISKENLSLLSGQENQIGEDTSTVNKTIQEPVLAEFINGQSINTPEIQEYIRWYNNFSSISFKEIENKTKVSAPLKVGNFNNELKGFVINNKKYAFELMACDERTKGCSFRINGIETDKVYSSETDKEPKTFNLNDEYELKINLIKFNFCDNKRFCDTYFEGYDLVDVSVEKKI